MNFIRRLGRRLFGPWGRRTLLLLAVSSAWATWTFVPPRPISEWTTTSRHPVDCFLTADRSRLVCLTARYHFIGDSFASVPEHGPLRVWDLATGRERLTVPGDGRWSDRPRMWTARDASWLLANWPLTPGNDTLRLWDLETGHERWSTQIVPQRYPRRTPAPVVSPDGRWIACQRSEPVVTQVLSTATGANQMTLGDAWPVAFSADGETVAAATSPPASSDGPATVTIWETATGRPRREIKTARPAPGVVALSPDGRWLAVGQPTLFINRPAPVEKIDLWDLRTEGRTAVAVFDVPPNFGNRCVTFSPDGSLLALPAFDGVRRRLWDLRSSPPRLTAPDGQPKTAGVLWPGSPIFSPDGTRFIEPGPAADTIAFHETADPDRLVVGSEGHLSSRVEFTPDGRTIVAIRSSAYLGPQWRFRDWINRLRGGIGQNLPEEFRSELLTLDARTGTVIGRVPGLGANAFLLGVAADGRSVWTTTFTAEPFVMSGGTSGGTAWPDGTMCVRQWEMPTSWPPSWLLAMTAAALLALAADVVYARSRCRRSVDGASGGQG
jgi:WD40 repeat protein